MPGPPEIPKVSHDIIVASLSAGEMHQGKGAVYRLS